MQSYKPFNPQFDNKKEPDTPPPYSQNSSNDLNLGQELLEKMSNLETMVSTIQDSVLETSFERASREANHEIEEFYKTIELKKEKAKVESLKRRQLNHRRSLNNLFNQPLTTDSLNQDEEKDVDYDRVFNKLQTMITDANTVLSNTPQIEINRIDSGCSVSSSSSTTLDFPQKIDYSQPKEEIQLEFCCTITKGDEKIVNTLSAQTLTAESFDYLMGKNVSITEDHKLQTQSTSSSLVLSWKLIGWFIYFFIGAMLLNSKICNKAALRMALLIESLFDFKKQAMIQNPFPGLPKRLKKRRNSF